MSTVSCDAIVAGDHDYYDHQVQSGEKDAAMETNNNNPDKPCNTSACYPGSQPTNAFGKLSHHLFCFGTTVAAPYLEPVHNHFAMEPLVLLFWTLGTLGFPWIAAYQWTIAPFMY